MTAEEETTGLDNRPKPVPWTRRLLLTWPNLLVAPTVVLVVLVVLSVGIALTNHSSWRNRYRSLANYQSNSSESYPLNYAINSNFPDPVIWRSNGSWHAFATNKAAGILQASQSTRDEGRSKVANLQYAISRNFVDWEVLSPAQQPLPETGKWALQGDTETAPAVSKANVWAPALIQRSPDKRYVLYYSAVFQNTSSVDGNPHPPSHCIGAAISNDTTLTRPFIPLDTPLVCPLPLGGAIDPTAFRDHDDTLYLAYKADGNNLGHGGDCGNTIPPLQRTPIMLQRLDADGTTPSVSSPPLELLHLKPAEDGPLIEAPALLRSPAGVYFLFFSSGCTRSASYNVRYATAPSVTGPYTRASTPLLQTGDWGLLAPGSMAVVEDGAGGWNVAFHARVTTAEGGVRAMFTAGLELQGNVAKVVKARSGGGLDALGGA